MPPKIKSSSGYAHIRLDELPDDKQSMKRAPCSALDVGPDVGGELQLEPESSPQQHAQGQPAARLPLTQASRCGKGLLANGLLGIVAAGGIGAAIGLFANAQAQLARIGPLREQRDYPSMFDLPEPIPAVLATGFTNFQVPVYPDWDNAATRFMVTTADGEADYGISLTCVVGPMCSQTEVPRDVDELDCPNAFALANRAAALDYRKRANYYAGQDHDNPMAPPALTLLDGTNASDAEWSYDASLERVVYPNGTEGTPCRTRVQAANAHALEQLAVQRLTDPLAQPRLQTGFEPGPTMREGLWPAPTVSLHLPGPHGQRDFGVHYSKTPRTATQVVEWLKTTPPGELDCFNEFASANRAAFLSEVDRLDGAINCESSLRSNCSIDAPFKGGRYLVQDEEVRGADGTVARTCRTATQDDYLAAAKAFDEAVAHRAAAQENNRRDVAAWNADKTAREEEVQRLEASAARHNYGAAASLLVGLSAAAVGVHRLRGQCRAQQSHAALEAAGEA